MSPHPERDISVSTPDNGVYARKTEVDLRFEQVWRTRGEDREALAGQFAALREDIQRSVKGSEERLGAKIDAVESKADDVVEDYLDLKKERGETRAAWRLTLPQALTILLILVALLGLAADLLGLGAG